MKEVGVLREPIGIVLYTHLVLLLSFVVAFPLIFGVVRLGGLQSAQHLPVPVLNSGQVKNPCLSV